MEEDTLYHKVTLPYTDAAPKGGETPLFLVLLLLVFFPPAAWYVMWKEKDYHRWYAWLIGIYGSLTLIGSFIMRLILIPYSDRLYASLGLEQPKVSPFSYVDYYIILGIAEIVLAVILYLISRKYEKFPKTWLIIGLIGLAFNSFVQPLTLVILTYSAYNNLIEQTRELSYSSISQQHIKPTPSLQDSTQTSNWKLYTDTNNLYSITLPKEFEVKENKTTSNDGILTNSIGVTSFLGKNPYNFNIAIQSEKIGKNDDLNTVVKDKSGCSAIVDNEVEESSYILSGVQGVFFLDTPCGIIGKTFLYVLKDDHLFEITFESQKSFKEYKQVADQILSTFKFLD